MGECEEGLNKTNTLYKNNPPQKKKTRKVYNTCQHPFSETKGPTISNTLKFLMPYLPIYYYTGNYEYLTLLRIERLFLKWKGMSFVC